MKRTVIYHWEEKDIRAGAMVYPVRGSPLLIGYIIAAKGKNEYVLIDQRDGLVLRSPTWATKKGMATYLSTTHAPVPTEEDLEADRG